VTSRWQIVGSYAYQDAFISSATAAAKEGAQLAQVPHHTASLWNSYKFLPQVSAALGLVGRSGAFAAIDNTVALPGYFRADAAVYVDVTETVRLQGNLENIFNRAYFANADSNTNISPGSPRALRVLLSTRF
jgi:catecholate siderophore receptor